MDANLAKSFVQVCGEVENVTRDTVGQVGNQKYKYATLSQVLDMLNPLLAKAKLTASCFVDGDSLRTILVHESGTMHDFGLYPLGGFSKQQERGSAISYARRYQLCAIFGITQEDDDAASAGNVKKSDMTTGATPQSVYGTGVKFKEAVAQIKVAISRAEEKEHFSWIQTQIEKVRTVDEEHAKRLDELVDLRRDEIEAFK